jgi:hypothetical protein
MTSTTLRALLCGGDRRSVAQSERARAIVEREPERVAELAHLAHDCDWLVSLRALDLLEKIAHEHADWVRPHKNLFIGPVADSDQWEIHLQIVRALPLFEWTGSQPKRVYEILLKDLRHPQKFVRTWALDSLAQFARRDPAIRPTVVRSLAAFERSGSKSLQTRARHIRKRCDFTQVP